MYAEFREAARQPAWAAFLCGAGGITLVAFAALLTWISPRFGYAYAIGEMPVVTLAALLVGAGLVFCFSLGAFVPRDRVHSDSTHPGLLMIVIAAGLAARLILFASEPMLEDDYQRYLWDGAVTANGLNPYRVAPSEALRLNPQSDLGRLATEAGGTLKRINHPALTTVYPSVSQSAFALAYMIKPWSLSAWRGVILAADIATLMLLVALLRSAGQSPLWTALYWWNPLVLKELFNSAHMDAIVVSLVLGALLLAIRKRPYLAATVLSAAMGAKLWPVLLLPIVLRASANDRRSALAAALVFAALAALILSPMLMAGMSETSGVAAFAQHWQTNSALFPAFEKSAAALLNVLGLTDTDAGRVVRGLIALVLGSVVLAVAVRPIENVRDILQRAALVVAVLVLLSPAQYPWYFVWFAPFLVFAPWRGMAILTATLPLYYTRFYFIEQEQAAVFSGIVVWVIWLPAWALIAWEYIQMNRDQTAPV